MKTENILFLVVLVSSFVPQLGVIWSLLFLYKWARGKQLVLESGVVWIGWVISTILTVVFLSATEETTQSWNWSVKFFVILTLLRISVLVFVNTGVFAGVLYLLERYRKTENVLSTIWQISFILSITTCLSFYALIFISTYILKSFFGEF